MLKFIFEMVLEEVIAQSLIVFSLLSLLTFSSRFRFQTYVLCLCCILECVVFLVVWLSFGTVVLPWREVALLSL